MRGLFLSGLYGACAVVALTFYSVYEWLDPLTPLGIGAFAIFAPALLVSLVLEEGTRPPKLEPLTLAQALLVAAIFGIAVPFMWSAPALRLQAIHMFPSKRAVERALDDRSADVQVAACEMIVTDRFAFDDGTGYLALVDRPDVATACLGAMPDSSEAQDTTTRLGSVWLKTLMSGARSCAYVDAFDALQLEEGVRATALLSCAIGADDDEHRKCCASRLSVAYGEEKLRDAVDRHRAQLKAAGVTGELLAAAWGEETFAARSGGVERQLGLQKARYRELTAEIACEAVTEGAEDAPTGHLEWLFATHDSCISEELAPFAVEPRPACVELLAGALRKQDVTAALCEADRAVRARRLEQSQAAKIADTEDFADITDAITASDDPRRGLAEWQGMLDDPESLRDLSPEERRLLREEARGSMMPDITRGGLQQRSATGLERLDALRADPRTAALFSDDPDEAARAKERMENEGKP